MPTVLADVLAKLELGTQPAGEAASQHRVGLLRIPDPSKHLDYGPPKPPFDSLKEYPELPNITELPSRESLKYNAYVAPGHKDLFVWRTITGHKMMREEWASKLRNCTRKPGGPRGMYKGLQNFGDEVHHSSTLSPFEQTCFRAAQAKARAEFKLKEPVVAVSLAEANELLEPSSAAGYSFPRQKKGAVLPQILARAQNYHDCFLRNKNYPIKIVPSTVAQRGGPSIIGQEKTRLVWVYPAEVINLEMRIAAPLYNAYTERPTKPMLYGNSPRDMMAKWFRDILTSPSYVSEDDTYDESQLTKFYGVDIKNFDSHISAELIQFGFDVISDNITFEDPVTISTLKQKANPRKLQRYQEHCEQEKIAYLQQLGRYMTHTPVLMPDGRMFMKHQGMPSGSAFTQLIDSIVNAFYIHFAAEMQQVKIQHLIVLGDDSGFTSQHFDVVQCSKDLKRTLGVEIHPDKCNVTTEPSKIMILGYTYNMLGDRFREDGDWFLMALCPERAVRDIATSFGRLHGIWLAGGHKSIKYCRMMHEYQRRWPVPLRVKVPVPLRVMLAKGAGIQVEPEIVLNNKHIFNPSYLLN